MRTLLLAIALAMSAGQAAAIGDHGSIQVHHGIRPTNDCSGEPGCVDVGAGAQYSGNVNEQDLTNPNGGLCAFGPPQPNGWPSPGVWANVNTYSPGSPPEAMGFGSGFCVWTSPYGTNVNAMGGGGQYDSYGSGHNVNLFVGPDQLNGNAGAGIGSQNGWTGGNANVFETPDGRTCAFAGFNTPNGGGNLGPFCA